MKAAFLTGKKEITLKEVPCPTTEPGGFLLKVLACGVCGSDVRAWEEGIPGRGGIGHEISGLVLETHEKAIDSSGFKAGDHVVVAPVSCGVCEYCLSGNEHMCPERTHAGFVGPGGFSEILSVPEYVVQKGAVYRVPDNLEPEIATLVEPLACVLHGQEKLDIGPGKSVAVIGGGPVGVMHAALSRYRGADAVFIADMNEERLKMASWVKADRYINARSEDTTRVILSETGHRGVDCVIVACSSPVAQSSAIDMTKTMGEVLFFSGLARDREEVALNVGLIHRKEISLKGSRNAGRRHFDLALRLLSGGRLPLQRLVTHVFDLEDVSAAFGAIEKGEAMKAVVRCSR